MISKTKQKLLYIHEKIKKKITFNGYIRTRIYKFKEKQNSSLHLVTNLRAHEKNEVNNQKCSLIKSGKDDIYIYTYNMK